MLVNAPYLDAKLSRILLEKSRWRVLRLQVHEVLMDADHALRHRDETCPICMETPRKVRELLLKTKVQMTGES